MPAPSIRSPCRSSAAFVLLAVTACGGRTSVACLGSESGSGVSSNVSTGAAVGGGSGTISVSPSGATTGAFASGSIASASGTTVSVVSGTWLGTSGTATSGSVTVTSSGTLAEPDDGGLEIGNGTALSCPDSASDAGSLAPSCAPGGPGMTNCGACSENCCASLDVLGGTFYRTYYNGGSGASGEGDPARVSNFRLDKYDVTVGRFRQFVSAWKAGWTPQEGSGKHAHLNAGQGLVNVSGGGGYEPGWLVSDNANVAPTDSDLTTRCVQPAYATWTSAQDGNENLPMDCTTWYEAYAFCIWDGAFLPSEAEWEYAAAGGSEQREYPWGSADPGLANQYSIEGDGAGDCYYPNGVLLPCNGVSNIAPVGTAAAGLGMWGQLDLVGNMYQWSLDSLATYMDPCTDCANLTAASYRVVRGGGFSGVPASFTAASRGALGGLPSTRSAFGFRCARTPSVSGGPPDGAATSPPSPSVCPEPAPVIGALPFVVDSEYVASGWQGDVKSISLAMCDDRSSPEAQGSCYEWTYAASPSATNAMVAWQYPANNFGSSPGYVIPPGATKVSFWAKGAAGDEQVGFGVGEETGSLCDDAILVPPTLLMLTPSWANYTLDLPAQLYASGEITAFYWSAAPQGAITFDVDDIEWQM